jgi:PKHD-type hydroxylase
MLLCVPKLFTEGEVETLRAMAAEGEFADGRTSAGKAGQEVKFNEELSATREQVKMLNQMVRQAFQRSQALHHFAWPKKVSTPFLSRYTVGMAYGLHFDNPIMTNRDGEPMRSDISMTAMLSDPESYDGGELSLITPFGVQSYKPPAGDAVFYATTMQHQVMAVTRGTRLAAVTWIQSLVKEPDRRQILFDLAQARQAMKDQPAGAEAGRYFHQGFSNLLKLWAEV